MKNEIVNIVWLKRDLRLLDHEPLWKAEKAAIPYRIIYLFEPSLISYPDCSSRHLQFIYHSIKEINESLKIYNRCVDVFYGEAIDVFEFLISKYTINTLFGFRESGTQITWNRDKQISSFCTVHNIIFDESQKDGVIRGSNSRDDWNEKWYDYMHSETIKNKYTIAANNTAINHTFQLPENIIKKIKEYPKHYQPAGETNAWRYLKSFVSKRGHMYHKHISKPMESRVACTRLSPYLAWGNISIRQSYQYIGLHQNRQYHKRAFMGALTRLHWHCHFIQKFETQCVYETRCINVGYELLTHTKNEMYLKAWKLGCTGYPLIDACMRAVVETGWINFRMRAMLVSFLTFNLDQDWRDGVYHLARQFLDYDPGIHYPQFQMQAGTTGINTVRLYNPVKNSKEHDPDGVFIKKWIPELQNVAVAYIHEPWKMSMLEQQFCNTVIGEDYPLPIVNLEQSTKIARDKIWGHKKHPAVQKEKHRLLATLINKK